LTARGFTGVSVFLKNENPHTLYLVVKDLRAIGNHLYYLLPAPLSMPTYHFCAIFLLRAKYINVSRPRVKLKMPKYFKGPAQDFKPPEQIQQVLSYQRLPLLSCGALRKSGESRSA